MNSQDISHKIKKISAQRAALGWNTNPYLEASN
jgi:hypothetical protein